MTRSTGSSGSSPSTCRSTRPERRLIRAVTRIERYRKGTRLLAEGEVARESWLVVDGCVRAFCADRTVAFYTELHPAIPPTYGTDAPSPVGFECLEDVIASASTRDEEARAFAEHPALESVCPATFRAMDDRWPSYFLFEPRLNGGWRW